MHNKFIGNKGEDLACNWLLQNNYEILHRNWRYSRSEIDIIAIKNNKIHFVEVKTRSSIQFGLPETSVDQKKFKLIQKAADQFLFLHPQYLLVQFDILAIELNEHQVSIQLFEDIYF
jgi:putative endonuclease